MHSFQLVAGSLLTIAASCLAQAPPMPNVDLGYALYKASAFNDTGRYYNFSNIRYAQPPLGDLRFNAPVPPTCNRSAGVQDGLYGHICPQAASAAWSQTAQDFVVSTILGQKNFTSTKPLNYTIPPTDPRESEDCLFLDVIVPEKILKKADTGYGAPVLVWIYGGGYTGGSKSGSGNPAGLLKRSADNADNTPELIYVAFNYRLGAFGWLAGPTLQSNGTANAGLLDQRLALKWVQTYIHLFGGDPKRVTVFGESAGAGSIMHQITAYGGAKGDGTTPFQQAIMQSPGFVPTPSNFEQEETLNLFLKNANVSTVQEARELPSEKLILANSLTTVHAPYGRFGFGPSVDGSFVPALPGKLLLQGAFDHSVRVMMGHNANEGLVFTDPSVKSDSQYRDFLSSAYPGITSQVLDYITKTLYPPIFDGSLGYTTETERLTLAISEATITCNTPYFGRALKNKIYAYMFSVPPALHGQDVAFTFYNGGGGTTSSVSNVTIAYELQKYITHYAETGVPSSETIPYFPIYNSNGTLVNLGIKSISEMVDPAANSRCDWWQKALYY